MPKDLETCKRDAKMAFMAGVAAVDPTKLVKAAVRQGLLDDWFEDREKPKAIHVLALGKGAPRMLWGLVESNVPFGGFACAPRGVPFPKWGGLRWMNGDHPMLGPASFEAGNALMAWIDELPPGHRVLVLLSGGASACCEVALDDANDLITQWQAWDQQGLDITQLNDRRAGASAIKGGRLGRLLAQRKIDTRVWILQDTPAPEAVGSGPIDLHTVQHVILADNEPAVQAAAGSLQAEGWLTYHHGASLAGEAASEVDAFLAAAATLPKGSALVAGGEVTVALPLDAPAGGRNQHSAALAAQWLHDHASDMVFLAAGTDGIDGTTKDAGACVTAADVIPAADVQRADATRHLLAADATVRTGATGTNVADVWIALRP